MNRLSIKLIVFLFVGTISACQKADLSAIDNLRDGKIAVIGHAGMGFPSPQVNIPPNSFESIVKAVEGYQVDAVEGDVQMSADGVLFLYHDPRLQSLTDCLGCMYEKESEALKECRYTAGFGTQNFSDHKLVELERIMERFSSRTTKPIVFFDLKTSPDCAQTFDKGIYDEMYVDALKAIFTKYNCQDWVIVESIDFNFLIKLQTEIPGIRLSYAVEITPESIDLAVEHDFYGLYSRFESTSKEIIKTAHDNGLFITLGIMKTRKGGIEMIELSPDFIYTDNILLLQSILN